MPDILCVTKTFHLKWFHRKKKQVIEQKLQIWNEKNDSLMEIIESINLFSCNLNSERRLFSLFAPNDSSFLGKTCKINCFVRQRHRQASRSEQFHLFSHVTRRACGSSSSPSAGEHFVSLVVSTLIFTVLFIILRVQK